MRELPSIDVQRIQATQAMIDQAFRHETPDQLPFFFALTATDHNPAASRFADAHAVEQQMTGWGNWDEPLENSLKSIGWWSQQTLSPLFPPPKLCFDCPQEIILTPFGVKHRRLEGGRIALDWSEPVKELSRSFLRESPLAGIIHYCCDTLMACSRSAMMSRISSVPTERRM